MKVKYTGNSDFQVFSAADFKKAELEGSKTTFAKDKPTEVPDAIGEALISSEGIFGQHSFEQVEDEEKTEAKVEDADEEINLDDAQLPASGDDATTEGTTAADTAATARTRSTGRGSSTRSR